MRFLFIASAFFVSSALTACSSSSTEPLGPTDAGHDATAVVDSGTDAGLPVIKASDYDQSCTKNEDCVQITEGDVCASCTCVNAAINKSDATREATAASVLAAKCPPATAVECGACGQSQALCHAGKCVSQECANEVCTDAGADDAGNDASGDASSDASGDASGD